jgi:asparagine synthase (glutamine-hydrolysing)
MRVLEPDMVGLLPCIVRHHGEPFADTSAVPTRYLWEMTRRHVKVALSGDVGDTSSSAPSPIACRPRS